MSDVKYPDAGPQYHAAVVDTANKEETKQAQHQCAKCLIGTMALVFIVLSLGMITLSSITLAKTELHLNSTLDIDILTTQTNTAVITLLIVGLVLLVASILVWVASCKPTAACSKIILIIFSIVMLVGFLLNLVSLIVGAVWLGNGYLADEAFNTSVGELHDVCCGNNEDITPICEQVDTNLDADCKSNDTFYTAVVNVLLSYLKGVAAFLGIVAFLNLFAFITSCCLICSRKRGYYYKPTTTAQ